MKFYLSKLNSGSSAFKRMAIFRHRQAGVTLLLAILVLATLLAISLSLAAILFVEIRTSGDLDRTEGAIYAATGVGEQSLFYLKRHVCTDPACASLATATTFSYLNGVALSGQPQVSTTSSPIFYDIIPPGKNFATANIYYFCGDLATSTGCGFGKVTVNYIASGLNTDSDGLYADLCQFDPTGATSYGTSTPCSQLPYSGSPTYWLGSEVELTRDASTTSWSTLDHTQAQELILYETNPSGHPINVSIATFGPDTTTPLGLPLSGETSVNINAANGTVSRKIQVIVPAGSSTSTSN